MANSAASDLGMHCLPCTLFGVSKPKCVKIYFIVSGEISVYLMKIKVVSITSELISYHFTTVNDRFIFSLCALDDFGFLQFQKWILPPLQIFEHL